MALLKIIALYTCLILSLPLVVKGNEIPNYVTCAGPNGDNATLYTKAEINFALKNGTTHMRENTKVKGTGGKKAREYPHPYFDDHKDTPRDLGTADRTKMKLFPIFKDSREFTSGMHQNATRIVFDTKGVFAAVLTHEGQPRTGKDRNRLVPCWETDKNGKATSTKGVPFSNPDPPQTLRWRPGHGPTTHQDILRSFLNRAIKESNGMFASLKKLAPTAGSTKAFGKGFMNGILWFPKAMAIKVWALEMLTSWKFGTRGTISIMRSASSLLQILL